MPAQAPPATKQELLGRLAGWSVVRDTGQATPQRDGTVRHVARITWVENDPETNYPIAKSLEDSLPVAAGATQVHPSEVTRMMARLEAKFEEYKNDIVEFFFPTPAIEVEPIIANNVVAADGSPLAGTQTQDEAHALHPLPEPVASAADVKAQTPPADTDATEGGPAAEPVDAGAPVAAAGREPDKRAERPAGSPDIGATPAGAS